MMRSSITMNYLLALVRAGTRFEKGQLVDRADQSRGDQQAA